jgi:hypothetical protein
MLNMREAWTDERLDDFARNVDKRFDNVDKRFDRLEGRMEEGFRELRGEISAMQRAMVQFAAALLAAQIGVIAALLIA